MKKKIFNNVSLVGCIDWDLKEFHGDDYSIFNGSSQNSYLVEEEKKFLVDTVWGPNKCEFVHNLQKEINLKELDFIVVNHSEPDHSGALLCLLKHIPSIPIYCSLAAKNSLEGQYGKRGWNFNLVKTGDEVEVGNGKKIQFLDMKMLHWPDSMATFLTKDNVLFSNDAFGQHFAVQEVFADKADQVTLWQEALKYFVNILNPFSPILLKKLEEIEALNLPIDFIAPSHGAVWRNDGPFEILKKYKEWANAYQENQITIVYDTMWNGTKKIAQQIAQEIYSKSKDTVVKIFNISKTDKNEIMTEIFKSSAIAVGSPTVGNGILSSVAGFLEFLRQLKFKNKKAAAFGCYGWSGESVNILKEKLKEAGFLVGEENVLSLWNPNEEDFKKVSGLVDFLL